MYIIFSNPWNMAKILLNVGTGVYRQLVSSSSLVTNFAMFLQCFQISLDNISGYSCQKHPLNHERHISKRWKVSNKTQSWYISLTSQAQSKVRSRTSLRPNCENKAKTVSCSLAFFERFRTKKREVFGAFRIKNLACFGGFYGPVLLPFWLVCRCFITVNLKPLIKSSNLC